MQDALDLRYRSRTSLFPWRGQFSPQLVELLLEDVPSGLIVDPFVGSGTSLFEAGRIGLDGFGSEINPAALTFAVLAELICRPPSDRRAVINKVQAVFTSHASANLGGLFATTSTEVH